MKIYRPQSIGKVNDLLSDLGKSTQLIAGGTDLLVESKYKKMLPENLVDISHTDRLNEIIEDNGNIVIGATATHHQIVKNPLINKYAPLLASACQNIGSQQIRNRGTIGGNICNASPCADSIPPLFTLNAKLRISGPKSDREISISDFFSEPYHTVLLNNEWLTHIVIDKLGHGYGTAFIKLGRRNALAISRINMAAVLELSSNVIQEARFAPGSVFPVWRRVEKIEKFLINKKASLALFEEAGKMLSQIMIKVSGQRWSTPYKEPVVAALTKRVLCMAAGLDYK